MIFLYCCLTFLMFRCLCGQPMQTFPEFLFLRYVACIMSCHIANVLLSLNTSNVITFTDSDICIILNIRQHV